MAGRDRGQGSVGISGGESRAVQGFDGAFGISANLYLPHQKTRALQEPRKELKARRSVVQYNKRTAVLRVLGSDLHIESFSMHFLTFLNVAIRRESIYQGLFVRSPRET